MRSAVVAQNQATIAMHTTDQTRPCEQFRPAARCTFRPPIATVFRRRLHSIMLETLRRRMSGIGLITAMSEPLLKISNHHAASCGDPPIIDGITQNCYVGYFENPHGEQWIFTLDRKTGKATLRGGDVGWNTELDVTDGTAVDLVLGTEEKLWLHACWSSARQQVVRK